MEIKHLGIQQILDSVTKGEVRIPAFQRGFVWEPDRVAYFMDSIYKRYPFGTLLFWRTNAQLKYDRKLGPLSLPDPVAGYPIEYVLDGQQRLTSVFCVFKSGLAFDGSFEWKEIFFDSKAEPEAREPQFLALSTDLVEKGRHFPLRLLFDSPEYRKATKDLDEKTAERIDDMSKAFQQVQIPAYVFSTDDKNIVSIIFERINRQGVPLDTLQLLCAWTWSEDFQLQAEFLDLSEELEEFGFGAIGEEENLLLRCCAAILRAEATPEALLELSGEEVRTGFPRVHSGIKGAVDFVRAQFRVEVLNNLPFQTLLVPLSVFFAHDGDKEIQMTDVQRKALSIWFWKTCFTRRYSSGVIRNLKRDIDEIVKLRDGKPSELEKFEAPIDPLFFIASRFLIGSVNTSTLVLMLSQRSPRSFISGNALDLKERLRTSNRTEFHHLMPKAFLETSQQGKGQESCLANMAFLSRADNRQLGGVAPSKYLAKLPANRQEILESALVSEEQLASDNFEAFVIDRAKRLKEYAETLMTN